MIEETEENSLIEETSLIEEMEENSTIEETEETTLHTGIQQQFEKIILLFNLTENDKPIYRDSDITLTQCLLLILAFSTRHKLTYEAMQDLLSLLQALSPYPNLIPNTLHMFWKDITEKGLSSRPRQHFVCTTCWGNLPSDKCQRCKTCNNIITKKQSYSTMSIKLQLESMFKRKFYKEICILYTSKVMHYCDYTSCGLFTHTHTHTHTPTHTHTHTHTHTLPHTHVHNHTRTCTHRKGIL